MRLNLQFYRVSQARFFGISCFRKMSSLYAGKNGFWHPPLANFLRKVYKDEAILEGLRYMRLQAGFDAPLFAGIFCSSLYADKNGF